MVLPLQEGLAKTGPVIFLALCALPCIKCFMSLFMEISQLCRVIDTLLTEGTKAQRVQAEVTYLRKTGLGFEVNLPLEADTR